MNDTPIDISAFPLELETIKCDLCESLAKFHKILAKKDRYGFSVQTVICKKCGNIFLNPRPTLNWYQWFYNHLYDKITKRRFDISENLINFFENEKKDGIRIYEELKDYIPENGKMLDIGCSLGGIAKAFEEKGWEVWGIDPMVRHVEFAKKNVRGTFLAASIEEFKPETRFDLIIVIRTLNHFFSPWRFLKEGHSFLQKNGFLYIEVLNSRFSFFKSHLRSQIDHPFLFLKANLYNYLSKSGFSLKTAREEKGYYKILVSPSVSIGKLNKTKNFYYSNLITLFYNSALFFLSNLKSKFSF